MMANHDRKENLGWFVVKGKAGVPVRVQVYGQPTQCRKCRRTIFPVRIKKGGTDLMHREGKHFTLHSVVCNSHQKLCDPRTQKKISVSSNDE